MFRTLLLLGAVVAVAVACGPAATQPEFTKEQSIKRATEDARSSRPEVGMQDARIDEVTAQMSGNTWQVRLRGRFLIEGASPPGGNAEIYEASEQDFVYDASTGRLISGRISDTRSVATAVVPTPRATAQATEPSHTSLPIDVADPEAALRAYFAAYERGDVQSLSSLLSRRQRGQSTEESLRRAVDLPRSWDFQLVSYRETDASQAQPEDTRERQREYAVVVEIHPPADAATPWNAGENSRFVELLFEDGIWRYDGMDSAPDIYPPGSPPGSKATPTSAAISGTNTPMTRPSVSRPRLSSYRRIEDHADSKGGGPVYIVDRDIEVRASVRGVKRLDVSLHVGAQDTAAVVSGVPGADGEVMVRLHLPEVGVTYVLDGTGVLADQRPGQSGTAINGRNEVVIPAYGCRVMAEQ